MKFDERSFDLFKSKCDIIFLRKLVKIEILFPYWKVSKIKQPSKNREIRQCRDKGIKYYGNVSKTEFIIIVDKYLLSKD
ncbi:hypothetical protein BpHYR1_053458 [Brachionus plicatilis]|uniref:Uncharacterized protein n=1 Tax=Brachionus plicatilis TaxID=10195 RepID=A0A3M7QQB0_BRAPC|nr:hypothetical protein BpHYR1_053458 [Brachionus plicatilis]